MNKNNVVFRVIPKNENADPDSICVYGWNRDESSEQLLDDNVEYGFWIMALAYYESAEMLYDKFTQSKGNYGILDSAGTTMCFLYRHYVELSLKYLYLKFACPSDREFETLLNAGNSHDLVYFWNLLKPFLRDGKKRFHCSTDIGMVENYIRDIARFDKDSMTMRYPITKKLKQTKERIRLDIPNLRDRMKELYEAFNAFDCDFPKYEMSALPSEEIEAFLEKYSEMKPKIESFLRSLESELKSKPKVDPKKSRWEEILEMFCNPHPTPFDTLSDDELILLDTLYYTGDAISSNSLILPKNLNEAKICAVKKCIFNMKRDKLEFGKPINKSSIGVTRKKERAVVESVSKAISVIGQN